jgi:hypothetical protein
VWAEGGHGVAASAGSFSTLAGPATRFDVSACGEWLLSGDHHGALRVWSLAEAQLPAETAHAGQVTGTRLPVHGCGCPPSCPRVLFNSRRAVGAAQHRPPSRNAEFRGSFALGGVRGTGCDVSDAGLVLVVGADRELRLWTPLEPRVHAEYAPWTQVMWCYNNMEANINAHFHKDLLTLASAAAALCGRGAAWNMYRVQVEHRLLT